MPSKSKLKFWGSLALLTGTCSVPFATTDEVGARETLEQAKYTEIKITGAIFSSPTAFAAAATS